MKKNTLPLLFTQKIKTRQQQLLLLLGASLSLSTAMAQKPDKLVAPYPLQEMRAIAKEVRSDGWLVFRNDLKVTAPELLKQNKAAFGLEPADELVVTEAQPMEGGLTRLRYAQYHAGVPVEGSDFSIYARNGKPEHAIGLLGHKITDTAVPALGEQKALTAALGIINAKRYAWQDGRMEADLRKDLGDSSATRYPTGKLVYAPTKDIQLATGTPAYRLAYRFEINTLVPSEQWAVIIDAQTGALLDKYSLRARCNNGSVNTLYNGTQTLQTHQDGSSYRLQDYCRPGGLIASKYSNTSAPGWGDTNYIYTGDNTWNQSFESRATATAQWATERANDYFWNTFQRRAGGGTDRERRVQVDHPDRDYDTYYVYADNKDYYHIGRNPFNLNLSLAELDVVAHEFTHSVAKHSSNLNIIGEPGALNESFADIFGLMTERSVYGFTDWVLGSRAQLPRAFANTSASIQAQAQFYNGPNWINPNSSFDQGGVHINCGVQNRWFYLISQGGFGDRGPVVPALGIDKAARIAFNALIYYLYSGANFAAARAATIQAAKNIYGDCSVEVDAVTKAWFGVGVGDPAPDFCVSEIAGSFYFCIEDGQQVNATYTVSAPAGATRSWRWDNTSFAFVPNGDAVVLDYIPSYADATTLYVDITYNGTTITKQATVSANVCNPCGPYVACRGGAVAPAKPTQQPTDAQRMNIKDFSAFPNPAPSILTVTLPVSTEQMTLMLHDSQGRLVQEQRVAFGQRVVEMNVSRLLAGMYLVTVADGRTRKTQRIQVTH